MSRAPRMGALRSRQIDACGPRRFNGAGTESWGSPMNLQRNSWEQREVQSFFHTFTDLPSLRQHGPTVIERGEGIYVFDVQGKRYIEGNSGLWNIVLGYDNPQLVAAATEQYRRFPAYH